MMLDFLYSDHERVASFLSQLHTSGSLQAVEQGGQKTKSTQKEGGLSFGPVKGGISQGHDWNREVRQTYDPLWRNSLKLIQDVEDKATINADDQLAIGQLRTLSGSLLAYDLSSLTSIMQSESMEGFIANGIPESAELSERSSKVKNQQKKDEASVLRSFLKELPLGIGFVFVTESAHFWFSVKREFLSLYTMDVPLKFPTHISGQWNVLGIVDALPEDHVEGIRHILDRNIDGLLPAMVLHMMQLTGVSTGMFGRPVPAYGLSPLVVYRDVVV